MEFILASGYREIHLADDLFTADMRHAEAVCREILARGLKFPWVPRSGLRVDRVSLELLEVMARAGCYHIPFGIESGNQDILNRIKKGITLEQVEDAVALAKTAGMETTGYFMVGMPGETMSTMQDTLRFASSLDLDYVKIGICVPLPGTPMYLDLEGSGLIKSHQWDLYTYATPPWELIESSEVCKEVFDELEFCGEPLLEIANRTMMRNVNGHYVAR
jgi:radical SAM superfamily enzyme YgiQ (UPF0313 family)